MEKSAVRVAPNELEKLYLVWQLNPTMPNLESMKKDNKKKKQQLIREQAPMKYRLLKLVYDHDIRLAQIPLNSSFKILRAEVQKCFPMLKTVLIKYTDADGDSMNVMSSSQLRIAESLADNVISEEPDNEEKRVSTLRLHIVQANPNQEPSLLEEEIEEETEVSDGDQPECKEVETDDWLFDFAQIFLTHVGIDPDSHIDLEKVGMELCSEALKETVTSEQAQTLFDKADSKLKEMAALAFYNCGNVHMSAAQKRIPIDEAGSKETADAQLNNAYDWLREKYTLAEEKYKEALLIKPDFYKALLALGQQQFEMAKLHWSFVLGKNLDLSKWDPTETIWLFNSAEKKIRAATKMWEKMEEQSANESKQGKKGELSKKNSQIHLLWGNLLFQRSQIECFFGLCFWDKNLEAAKEKFKLAGVSEPEISMVVKHHCWNWNEEEKA